MNEESLFAAALEKPTRAERVAFLEQACGADVALRQRVERLVAAHDHGGGILERGVDAAAADFSRPELLRTDHLFAGRRPRRPAMLPPVWTPLFSSPIAAGATPVHGSTRR